MSQDKYPISSSYTIDTLKLCEINQHLKAALTDLLNTEFVRSDKRYRTCLQELLVDMKQKICKMHRRISNKDQETAASIAISFGPTVCSTGLRMSEVASGSIHV
jgi:hypothetical protein